LHSDIETDVRLAKEGNKEAFIRLIKQHEAQMFNMARSIVRRDEDCADAMQEAVLKAYRALTNLNHHAYFKTWLFRILINECNMILRKQARIIMLAELPEVGVATAEYSDHLDLRQAIYRLEEVSRNIVILFYFQDLPMHQIAEMMDMSVGAVKTRLHRARHTLAEWLDDTEERKMNG
jgi:RNA polymerase sigma factor (sigma-70 family)